MWRLDEEDNKEMITFLFDIFSKAFTLQAVMYSLSHSFTLFFGSMHSLRLATLIMKMRMMTLHL